MKQYAYAFVILFGLIAGTSLLLANEVQPADATSTEIVAPVVRGSHVDRHTVRVGEKYGDFIVTAVGPTSLSSPYDKRYNITVTFSASKKISGILHEGEERQEGLYWIEVDPAHQFALPSLSGEPVTKIIPTGGDGVFRKHGPNTHVEVLISNYRIIDGLEPLPFTTVDVVTSTVLP